MVDSKSRGAPTAVFRRADGRDFYLHSRHDPVEEARFFVQGLSRRERTLYAALGFGLGYHVKELLHRVPQSSHVVVVEPSFACLSARLMAAAGDQACAWMHNHRLHYLTHQDPQVAPISLVDRLTRLRLLSLELVTHIPTVMTAEDFYRALLAEIPRKFPAAFRSHLAALDRMLENSLLNCWANLPHAWNSSPIQLLRGKWSERALVIISAGPSLSRALPTLREFRGDTLLLATGTTARILMTTDIRPDLVVSMDPYEPNVAHFKGWETADIPLVCPPRIHRDILAAYAGPKFIFSLQEDPPIPLSHQAGESEFWQGGSVAFSALQLAHYLEANPVILVGQDFAFSDGHTHADGCIVDSVFDTTALPADYYPVPGVSGKPVITNRTYHSYLLYMQDYLQEFARQKPGARHINTSTTGAKIKGTEQLSLEEALALHGPGDGISPRSIIESALGQGVRISREAQRTAIDRWTHELDRVLSTAGRVEDFDRLFGKFKTTSFYAQAARSYDDIHYLHETRCRDSANLSNTALLNRFREHLERVSYELRKIKAAM